MKTPNSKSTPCLASVFLRCYHLKQKLAVALGLATAALLLPSNASAQCVTANPGAVWQNTAMTAQTGTFTATFDATPSASPTNSVVALSDGAQTAYANFSCLARFNPTGDIDARNGGAFAAASTIPYSAGVSYHFRLVVNVAAQTYSIYVTPAGGSELTVGLNYAFRIAAATLNWWGVSVETAGTGGVGTVTVCNFSTGGTIPQVATPVFSPPSGTYTSAQDVTITSATSSALIRFTTDGSVPTETNGTLYSGPLHISGSTTITAIAYETGFSDSAIASASYTITTTLPPAIEINSGGPAVSPFVADEDFTGGTTIDHANTIDTSKVTNPAPAAVYQSARVTATVGAGTTFSYTIGGFTAGSSSTVRLHFCETFHTTAGSRVFNVSINGTPVLTNFDIFATAGGQNIANVQQFTEPANSSGQYVILFTTVVDKALVSGIEIDSTTALPPQAATPVFSPGGGTYTGAQNVTITSATSGASIRYTLDGSTPSATAGTLYSGPVNISSTATLKADAYESGFTNSAVASSTYTISTGGGGGGPLPEHVITGYYQDFDNGAKVLRLTDVPMTYRLIAVAFATSTGTPGQVTFSVDSGLSSALGGYSQAQFIADIATCKARGQHVIISVGGALGAITVANSASATAFGNSVKSLMTTWGFEGVDIDLENGINPTFLAQGLRMLPAGSIITMAPQTVDVASKTSDYLALALSIKDILTICNCQYYNSGSQFGADGKIYNEGTVDFLVALPVIQLQAGLAPSQVGLGLPASPSGAGSGYVSPSVVVAALRCLETGQADGGTYHPPTTYPGMRGAMDWSINWDASNGYNFANTVSASFSSLP